MTASGSVWTRFLTGVRPITFSPTPWARSRTAVFPKTAAAATTPGTANGVRRRPGPPEGWTAEIEIPLSTIKYDPKKGASWGIGLARFVPRLLELDTWPGPTDAFGMVSQFGVLVGLDLQAAKKKLELVPHLVGRLQREEKASLDVGVDLRWALSQDISANLTVNPDFATIEADQEQINLTRFELSLPEKRNFFLEGSEIYSQRIHLFYSRRVADIWGGAKLYGKKGGTEFAAMAMLGKADSELGRPQPLLPSAACAAIFSSHRPLAS